jgi:enterochelin esterase-like enzyme
MKKAGMFALVVAMSFARVGFGQQALAPKQAVSRTIAPGNTDSFALVLQDGDYVVGSIAQQGKVDVTVLNPDRSIHQRFAGPPRGPKLSFAFAAEGGGTYSIGVTNPGDQPVKYEVLVESIASLTERLQPEPWREPLPSPHIQALRSQIEAGQTSTEAFWKEMAERGTPLVEPFGSDGRYQLVTFLWRAQHDTRNVLVIGGFQDPVHSEDLAMRHLGTSDVWYLTVKLPAGARFDYSLSPNDPMTWDGPRAAQRDTTRQMDPLNRNVQRLYCAPEASKFVCRSVAELPGATPQRWTVRKPGTPEGRIEIGSIKSDITGIERTFSVYVPANYRTTGRPATLVVLFDGPFWLPNDWFDQRPWMLNTLDGLISASEIPPTVVVFVNNDGNRRVDLMANTRFGNYVVTELVPWIRAHYNVTTDPASTVVGGYSAGGLQAAFLGLRHSEVFGNVISQSGAFWWAPDHNAGLCSSECQASGSVADRSMDATTEPNWMAKQYVTSPRLPLHFYLEAGTFEIDRWGKGGDILEPTRHLRDVLLAKGYDVHYRQVHGGHSGLSWRETIADALVALLRQR